MRKAVNENPLVQAALLGVLAIVVGFVLITRVLGGGSAATAPAASDAPASTTGAAATTAAPGDASATAAPATDASTGANAASAAADGEFVAGPGLPADVVKAYADGKVVTLLIVRHTGLDDRMLKTIVERLRNRSDTAVFVTRAAQIARYSRITQGADVQRVPALVVVQQRRVAGGSAPVAAVSYGFRGPASVEQAVDNALYEGRHDLPFYPQ